jgi:hypothetical protein
MEVGPSHQQQFAGVFMLPGTCGIFADSRIRHVHRSHDVQPCAEYDGQIYTVDIGRNVDAAANVAGTIYPDYVPGEAFLQDPALRGRIELIVGDSREIDFSSLYGTMGMVIVDGGHSHEIAKSDTENALRLVRSAESLCGMTTANSGRA